MTATSLLRLRYVLVRRGLTLAAVLLVVGVVTLGGAWWIYAHPPTTEVTDFAHEQTIQSSLETKAVVTEQTRLYDRGATLRNQPIYLRSITPVVTLIHRTSVPGGQPVHVSQRLVLVTEAVHEDQVFWRTKRTLMRTETTTQSGEVTTQSRFNITALQSRLAQRQAAIDGAGSLYVALRYRVHYETERYAGSFSKRAPLTLEENWYAIPTPSTKRTERTTVRRTATVPRSSATYLVPGAAGLVALVAGLGVGVAWHTRLREENPAVLRQRLERQVHADWVSEGTLDDIDADRHISIRSLEGLVDVAIDTDRRVIHDPEREVFAVVDDAAIYYYYQPEGTEWQWQGDPFGQQL